MRVPPRVSLALPVYNEEETLPELLRRTTAVLDALPGGPHEIVLVDDGSRDRTLEMLEEAARRDHRIVVVALSRNFGHQAAISAALDHVTGDVTVVMDADLQDPPEVVPQFLDKYHEGYDVVYAKRANRKEARWLRMSYHMFYRLLSRMSKLHLPLDAGDFALLSRRVVDQLRSLPERHRYLRGLRAWVGYQQVGITVNRAERFGGTSKYSLTKLMGLAFDGIFSFSTVPLRAATVVGALAVGLSALFAIYQVFAKFFLSQQPRGFTATLLVITFLSGVNLFFLGVIGEYVGRVYEQVKARPVYVVGRIIRRGRAGVDAESRAGAEREPVA
ncbi:MAG TPA: glycosyltransferase family 2 protein [Gemmatimonadaceae bacterium]|nr:glycosyltransferase family 2 protein [Gemmatimonadaceae bacterium]